jgi:antitoxin component YwqK of YwqJK toxin-antitoxin module
MINNRGNKQSAVHLWHKVDRGMWNIGHMPDTAELVRSINGCDGLITLKGEGKAVLARGGCNMGIPYGPWMFWHSNGCLAKQYGLPEKRFAEPSPKGTVRELYADGRIALEGCYGEARCNMVGTWKGWGESGEVSLIEGKRDIDGRMRAVFFKDMGLVVFADGSPYGGLPSGCGEDGYRRCMILLPEGQKAYLEGYCRGPLRQGWWKLWMYDGRVISLAYYRDGLPDGLCLIIDPWVLRNINNGFREFMKNIGRCPYMVYFEKGRIVTKEEYEQDI